MLEEKKIYNIVDAIRQESTIASQINKKEKNHIIASKIIKQKVNYDLYTNIIGDRDLHQSSETMQQICFAINQGFVCSIHKELLTYLCIAYPLGYENKATTIFAKVE